jgi:CO dehydrogenase nickel-insertion accessory protein CooC1
MSKHILMELMEPGSAQKSFLYYQELFSSYVVHKSDDSTVCDHPEFMEGCRCDMSSWRRALSRPGARIIIHLLTFPSIDDMASPVA